MSRWKTALAAGIVLLVAVYVVSGAPEVLTLDRLQAEQSRLQAWLADEPAWGAGGFFLIYVIAAALSLPGVVLLTLLAGALFGLVWGVLLVSFASTLGATLAFLLSRWLLRGVVERRFRRQLDYVNRGMAREGAFYLFSLRLIPLFPFFVINLVMGLTRMRVGTFYWVSQLGMLPGTLVYVNAGRELGQLESLGDILSPSLIISFALLGLFPLLSRRIVRSLRRRRAARRYSRPSRFDYDIVVIGAGSAGLVASYIAAALRARVALVERASMGGECLNTGCVPSKALLRAARAANDVRDAARFGVHAQAPCVDFAAVMDHVRESIRRVAPHDSRERYESLGVEVFEGQAFLQTPWRVSVGERALSTRQIIIATGGRPRIPELPGLENVEFLTSENVWQLESLPKRLVILGAGNIGCELGQAFVRLGSEVTLVSHSAQILPRESEDVADVLRQRLEAEGATLRLGWRATRVETDERHGHALLIERDGEEMALGFDRLLIAVGRVANVSGLGLEALGIPLRDDGTLEVDETLRSLQPNIWACGDVAGPYQLTHAGSHQAWHAAVNALFGAFKTFKVDYRTLPMVTYTQPEVARVGLSEREAQRQGIAFETTRFEFAELDRAIAEGATEGFVKVLTVPGKGRILGATLVGEHAGELLTPFLLAMRHGLGLNKLLGTLYPYPTLSESSRAVAGLWRQRHKPERILAWLARYFAWRRRGKPGKRI
ncbi:FAD-dependent oxidoreductase [Halomonas shantousis]